MLAGILALSLAVVGPMNPPAPGKPLRIRDLGVRPGILDPGPLNAITDVPGVRVGHFTLKRGDSIRTGVTAVLPHGGNLFQQKAPAAAYVGNGFGKAAGLLQVQELGTLETPIILTNTLSVAAGIEGAVRWTLDREGNEDVLSVNAVVGETNDGYLNDIRGMHITPDQVIEAIDAAAVGPVGEGAVGAGTGTRTMGFKGGVGTSSRTLPAGLGGHTVGVLVQSNYGGVLTIDGVRVGEALGRHSFRRFTRSGGADGGPDRTGDGVEEAGDDGSCMIIIATDAPLDSRNLQRLAKRAVMGLARTGSSMSNGSGDFIIAFSTAYRIPHGREPIAAELLANDQMSPLFHAVVEATEEALYNSLTTATTTDGRDGRTVEAIPIDRLRQLLAR
jgi:D-aminopeptidase